MSTFAKTLIAWQREHGRHDLPWQTNDAYRVWLSEIMLQQTQVDTVIPYYARFLARFPDLPSLAAAPVEDVLTLWSGLGYYARARNLHKCAQTLIARHGGVFPADPALLAELPGIGRSTAAAISAFAYGTRAAILDGNVKRVLARAFGIEGFPGTKPIENRLWELADSLLPAANVDVYTQAQMDLGATVCTRGRPACARCPLADVCVALRDGRVAELPTRRPKKETRERSGRFAAILADGAVLLERRPPSGIWGGLLSLPELPEDADTADWVASHYGLDVHKVTPLASFRHVFTHFTLTLEPESVEVGAATACAEPGLLWHRLDQLDAAALPAPIRKLLEQLVRRDLFSGP
ncbi:MAG: A/G-specific adenine glycosylase [Zoogloea oleivorans]|uniref:A/G-specific adenine glycosylase n=1 Tax=Zoogloea oleivorans TaxID=1552750 RepID=UPI002A36A43E|nr:A/G-specific adenine glycosylase [Zoogloea oleivorans]MDY0035457.1 A/G-specific adenine glycosylase [Zoogloea oleivorans]